MHRSGEAVGCSRQCRLWNQITRSWSQLWPGLFLLQKQNAPSQRFSRYIRPLLLPMWPFEHSCPSPCFHFFIYEVRIFMELSFRVDIKWDNVSIVLKTVPEVESMVCEYPVLWPWGSERLNNLPAFIQYIHIRTRIPTQAFLIPRPSDLNHFAVR